MNAAAARQRATGICRMVFWTFAGLTVWPGLAWSQPILTLDEARQELVRNNPSFSIAQRTLEQTALLERQARAILLPFVNVTGQYVLNDEELRFEFPNVYAPLTPYLDTVFDGSPELQQFYADNPDVPDPRQLAGETGDPSVIQYRHEVRGIGTVRQTLFNARAFPLLRLAELSQSQAEIGSDVLARELDAALIELYFTAEGLRRMTEIAERNLELARMVEEQTRIAFEEGVGARFEMTRSEVARVRAEREYEAASHGYEMAREALATLLHRGAEFETSTPHELSLPESTREWEADLGVVLPELRMLDARRSFEEARAREARARFAPEVFAQFQAFLQRSSAFGGSPFSWNLTLQASWDLYDGGLRRVEREEAELEALKVDFDRQDQEVRRTGELRRALLAVESERRSEEAARAEAELARENLELTLEARQLGVATGADVQLAQSQLYLSELAETAAELAVLQSIYRAHHAAGRLFEE
ncbi:MAG: TolC family protein [Deltaproteobacteria bacterium]|nr:MAG: TolC family protein [Deltaproteobacteria bacterium]